MKPVERFLKASPRPTLHGAVLDSGKATKFALGLPSLDEGAVFEIGSIGKVFTTTLLALMVRDGIVSLDDPIARFRPRYPFSRDVTLGHLASHTGGIDPNPVGGWTMLTRGRTVAQQFQPPDLEAFLLGHTLRAKRLGKFAYSNVGMALLGHILADCLGMDYGRAITERVLTPLRMFDTRIDWKDVPEGSLVVGHDARGRKVPPFEWRGFEPAGVWRSTLNDMIRFIEAQLGIGPDGWSSLAQDMTVPRGQVRRDTMVGLGWMVSKVDGIGSVAWHSGGTFGQHAVVGWTPMGNLGVVLLSNQRPPLWHHLLPSRRLEDLADRLMLDALDVENSASLAVGEDSL